MIVEFPWIGLAVGLAVGVAVVSRPQLLSGVGCSTLIPMTLASPTLASTPADENGHLRLENNKGAYCKSIRNGSPNR